MKNDHGILRPEPGDQAHVVRDDGLTGGRPVTVNTVAGGFADCTTAGGAAMRIQLSLLHPLAAGGQHRANDPHTSIAAARAQTPERLSKSKHAALVAIVNAGRNGLTDFELAERTGYAQTSIGVRRGELVRAGYVQATTRTRMSPSSTPSIVWVSTELGQDRFRQLLGTDGAA